MPDPGPAPVYAGVDGSASTMPAVELAADEAAGRGVDLVLVQAVAGPVRHPAALAQAEAVVRARHPGLAVTSRCVPGDPATVLVRESQDGCLLVVGHRGHCASRSGTGSVAESVVARATVAVVVHRPLSDVAGLRPVLVGLAPHRVDDALLEFAFATASRRGAPLYALTVWTDFATLAAGQDTRTVAGDAEVPADAIRRWSDRYPEVTVQAVGRHGLDATIALVAASHLAQLAVIGAGSGGCAVRTGSTAHTLVHRCACPVAVVRAVCPQETVEAAAVMA